MRLSLEKNVRKNMFTGSFSEYDHYGDFFLQNIPEVII